MEKKKSTRKPLVIIEQDEELNEINEDLSRGREMMKESMEFLKRQADENWKKWIKIHWDRMAEILKLRGLLPEDYSEEKYSLIIDNGVLTLETKDGDSSALAKILLGFLDQ